MRAPVSITLAALLLGPSLARAGVPEVWTPPEEMRFEGGSGGEVSQAPWWESWGDARLSAFVSEALAHNGDAEATLERVQQAEALARQVRASLLPQISATGSLSASPTEAFLFQIGQGSEVPEGVPSALWSGSAFLVASYPIDLWGKTSLSTRSAYRSAAASEADLENLRLALSSQVAEALFDLLAAREQLAVQEAQVATTAELLQLMELRYEGGQVTGLDVLQQRSSLAQARAQIPVTRANLATLEQRLLTLLGRPADQGLGEVDGGLPSLPAAPGLGAPSDLLDNRPDLRAAQLRLESKSDARRSASLGYLPSLSATAQVGYQGRTDVAAYLAAAAQQQAAQQQKADASTLYRADGDPEEDGLFSDWSTLQTWNVGLSLSVPLFTGGRTYSGHQAARADERAQASTLQQLTLKAVRDVTALVAREGEQALQVEAVKAQEEAARLAFENARERYISGLDSYLNVLTSQNAYRGAQLSYVVAQRALLSTRVQLHVALGGPWTRD